MPSFAVSVPAVLCLTAAAAEPAASLPNDVYVWQRDWKQSVRDSVAEHATNFRTIVVLAAEVSWKTGEPSVVDVALDYPTLKAASRPVGLALRIGPCREPFWSNQATPGFVADLAGGLIADAKTNGLSAGELQIDFDCPESKLDTYRTWLSAIRRRLHGVPLVITALPSWLNQPSFGPLIAESDGYVLQVHSLERPVGINAPFTLCDPVAARRAVERAGKFALPFRVALPTYGYVIAFNNLGQFAGLSAEGPDQSWPADYQLREVRTDPLQMAGLVKGWETNRPPSMRGIIWYRLPVAGDSINLRWPTLAAIMAARTPREDCRAVSRHVEPGLVEITLVNDGELDLSSRPAIRVQWLEARFVAGDGLNGFDLLDDGTNAVRFQAKSGSFRLPAGENKIVGWLRLSQDRDVQIELQKM